MYSSQGHQRGIGNGQPGEGPRSLAAPWFREGAGEAKVFAFLFFLDSVACVLLDLLTTKYTYSVLPRIVTPGGYKNSG